MAVGYTAVGINFQPDSVEVIGSKDDLEKLEAIQPIYPTIKKFNQTSPL